MTCRAGSQLRRAGGPAGRWPRSSTNCSPRCHDEQWPLTYLQVYGDATLEDDFGQAVDVLRRVIDLMAEKDVGSAKLPEIERMARDENRVVIRVRPYATFATPPRHVYQADDIDTLTHFTSSSQPW